MKRKHILLFLVTVFICLAIMFWVGVKCLKESKHTAVVSAAMSIHALLATEFDKGNPNLEKVFSPADEQWRFLTAKQYDKVISEIEKSHNLDAPARPTGQPLVDLWGNRFEIGYRKLPNQHYVFLVISKGPDVVYGTKDDIVSGYGALPPPKLDK